MFKYSIASVNSIIFSLLRGRVNKYAICIYSALYSTVINQLSVTYIYFCALSMPFTLYFLMCVRVLCCREMLTGHSDCVSISVLRPNQPIFFPIISVVMNDTINFFKWFHPISLMIHLPSV